MLRRRVSRIGIPALFLILAVPQVAQGQRLALNEVSADARPWGPSVRVTDERIANALEYLSAASFRAHRTLVDLNASRLPLIIGTPAQLAEISVREGGPTAEEVASLRAVAAVPNSARHSGGVAWVMFRSEGRPGDGAGEGWIHRIWLSIEADSVESWIRQAGGSGVEEQIWNDYLAILAHELVAHIGSIAASCRIGDLCEDPDDDQRERSRAAAGRGETEPPDGDMAACALIVENLVRAEINQVLAVGGGALLPARSNYSLETLNFERARRRLFPTPPQHLRRLIPIRN